MDALVSSGRIVDLVLILVVLEAAGLLAYRAVTGRGLAPIGIALMLLPGVCLLLALRAALMGERPAMVLAWLTLALVVHLADMWQRRKGS